MPRLSRLLTFPFAYRRALRTLERIADRLETQNVLLARLADHFAPIIPTEAALAEPSYSYFNAEEGSQILSYIERTEHAIGRPPTEEEILSYLSDEATQALHSQPPD